MDFNGIMQIFALESRLAHSEYIQLDIELCRKNKKRGFQNAFFWQKVHRPVPHIGFNFQKLSEPEISVIYLPSDFKDCVKILYLLTKMEQKL